MWIDLAQAAIPIEQLFVVFPFFLNWFYTLISVMTRLNNKN
jgi:hypothetical protein